MKKGILLTIVALALVFGGCGGKKGQSFSSTTTVAPPGASAPTGPTVVTLQINAHPVNVFFNGSVPLSRVRFDPNPNANVQITGPNPVGGGPWKQYILTSLDPAHTQNENIYVNYDDKPENYYDRLFETPNTSTMNLYIGSYYSNSGNEARGTATIIVGDANIFAQ